MTVLSAQLMVGLYVVSLLVARQCGANTQRFRLCWTMACSVLTAHILLAFHERHHWSWTEAVQHTTRVTERVIGTSSGIEIWFNVLFVSWWWIDVALRWLSRTTMSPRYELIVQVMWSFMLLNATGVFGPAYWKWIVPIVGLLLVVTKPHRATSDLEPRHR